MTPISVVRPIPPRPGQESVWTYPRPPRLERTGRRLRVVVGETVVAETTRGLRVLETAHPPTYYFPPADVRLDLLRPHPGLSACEWKGLAEYLDVVVDGRVLPRAAWRYPDPLPRFADLRGHVAFYPGRVDGAFVDDERAEPQPGDLFGGWVTSGVVGPFKGAPGTWMW